MTPVSSCLLLSSSSSSTTFAILELSLSPLNTGLSRLSTLFTSSSSCVFPMDMSASCDMRSSSAPSSPSSLFSMEPATERASESSIDLISPGWQQICLSLSSSTKRWCALTSFPSPNGLLCCPAREDPPSSSSSAMSPLLPAVGGLNLKSAALPPPSTWAIRALSSSFSWWRFMYDIMAS